MNLRTDQKNITNLNNKEKSNWKKKTQTELKNLWNNNKNSAFLLLKERKRMAWKNIAEKNPQIWNIPVFKFSYTYWLFVNLWKKNLFQIHCSFLISYSLIFLLVSCMCSLHILDINPLSDMIFVDIFSQSQYTDSACCLSKLQ